MIKKLYHAVKPFYFRLVLRKRLNVSLLQRRWEHGLGISVKDAGKIIIQKNCNFRGNLQLRAFNDGVLSIGDGTFINSNTSITARKKISIGNNVKIANNVVIVDHDHNYKNNNVGYVDAPVIIGDGVWIGANSVILKGVTIGNGAVVGAGSVVNSDVPENTVVAGNPSHVIKKF